MFNIVLAKLSRVDVLINNVGMNLLTPSVADAELVMWQKIMDTNLNGTFLCSRKASRIMQGQKKGKIVNEATKFLADIAGKIELKNVDYDPIHGGRIPTQPPGVYDQWRAKIAEFAEKLK